jgi:hypothetical protein
MKLFRRFWTRVLVSVDSDAHKRSPCIGLLRATTRGRMSCRCRVVRWPQPARQARTSTRSGNSLRSTTDRRSALAATPVGHSVEWHTPRRQLLTRLHATPWRCARDLLLEFGGQQRELAVFERLDSRQFTI